MKVYVDTSALLPLMDAGDADHAAVKASVERLMRQGAAFFTSSYTMVEAGALVRRRLGAAAFGALGRLADTALEIVFVEEELHHRAWGQAARASGRGPSLVDCAGLLLMEDLGVKTALALDAHFERPGFERLP